MISKLILLFFFVATSNIFSQSDVIGQEHKDYSTSQLLGCLSRSDFLESPFKEWYEANYQSYAIDTNELKKINLDSLSQCSVTVVFGSWCPDSRQEVPEFLKVCDFLNIDKEKVKIIGVDKSKDVNAECAEDELVEYVPTYFFYYNGRLLKKIDDHSNATFEQLFSTLY